MLLELVTSLQFKTKTSERRWCENHILYFILVQYKGTDRVRRNVCEFCLDIFSSLIRLKTFDEIVACKVELKDDEVVKSSNP
jgi:hypothetical protein